MNHSSPERLLVRAGLAVSWDSTPEETRRAIHDLFLDWVASAVAGSRSEQAQALDTIAGRFLGGSEPADRAATVVTDFRSTPALIGALVNGAAGHVVEMDDLHNASIYHPATCVFPAALSVAEFLGSTGADFLAASIAGYEVSLRVGEALGPEHYVYFHTTGTAGTVGAAVSAGHLLGLDEERMLWALGNASSQAAGLWQFLEDGAMTKQLHTAKASFNGALAALLAAEGFTGPAEGLMGDRAMLPAMTPAGALRLGVEIHEELVARQRDLLVQGIVLNGEPAEGSPGKDHEEVRFSQFKTPEVSFKYHASCRHTHPAVDALLAARAQEDGFDPDEVTAIRAYVYSGAYERLRNVEASSPWAAKFNLPFCLAQTAIRGSLGLDAFTQEALGDERIQGLMQRVKTAVDPELDRLYPRHWASWVEIELANGRILTGRVETPKGDPENPLTEAELADKFRLLAGMRLTEETAEDLLERVRRIPTMPRVQELFAGLEAS